MIGITFFRVLRNAFRNFRRNVWLSIATTVIMTLTLLVISFLYIVNVVGTQVLTSFSQKVDIAVIFKDSTTPDQIATIQHAVASRSDVADTHIISSDEALDQFRTKHKNDPYIEQALSELQRNPLPSSMYIVAKDPQFYTDISNNLQNPTYSQYIEKVNFEDSKTVIERLIHIMTVTKNTALLVTGIFAVLVMLIMFNTIRLAIYSFREEIDIMRLVGASRWYIQSPFIVESMLVAIISVAISIIITFVLLNAGADQINRFFFAGQNTAFDIYAYATSHWVQLIGTEVGVALILAIMSSYIAVRRYLK
ncbi:MAG TPA: permease-like cell division protein FtsX [Candidatus Andersenbacteria bacterium]|nr:permease-like cell division protein FtsX [Candidatus Andersenbacteria bacterium]